MFDICGGKSGSTDLRSRSKCCSCGGWKDLKRIQKDTLQKKKAELRQTFHRGGFIQKERKKKKTNQVQRPRVLPCGECVHPRGRKLRSGAAVLVLNYGAVKRAAGVRGGRRRLRRDICRPSAPETGGDPASEAREERLRSSGRATDGGQGAAAAREKRCTALHCTAQHSTAQWGTTSIFTGLFGNKVQ